MRVRRKNLGETTPNMSSYRQDISNCTIPTWLSPFIFDLCGMLDFFIRVHYRWALFVNGGIGAAFRVPVNRDKWWVNPGHCSNLSRGRSSIQINLDQQQKYTHKKYTAKYIDHAGSRTGSWHKESSYAGGRWINMWEWDGIARITT